MARYPLEVGLQLPVGYINSDNLQTLADNS